MKATSPETILLKDYTPPKFLIKTVDLCFWLHNTETRVTSKMKLERHENSDASELFLNGEELKLISIKRDGKELKEGDDYRLETEGLSVFGMSGSCELEIENMINPEANKALDGLYKSGPIFCSQNEPEGFRRITYYIDRPDVMAKFTTKIIADKKDFPILLSNGNPVDSGELEDGQHFVTWEDPFPKPSYLYALVAGDLGLVQDSYRTTSGKNIDLRIYCDKGNESKCDHAMKSLIESMRWDEKRFGLEYDLDIYMIVAVDSFNMGAMENKGLNIFNSAFVLADPKTATDQNFLGIESVIGHEYFHNWTGNRVTCRDWFQLTLKEGLTVFRDQEFSSDLNSRPVQRIKDVESVRSRQFVEDAGPTAHPIKPNSYIEINNFYSATVYEKGAEVIRMIYTLLGETGFRKGMNKYFELFDGQAVTTEDFIYAMSTANGDFDFKQFKLWYSQAGTPEVDVEFKQDLKDKTVTLTIEQTCPETPGQKEKSPFHMPFMVGLVGEMGQEVPLQLKDGSRQPLKRGLLELKERKQTFVFENIAEKVVPSLNRGFSAPIKLRTNLTKADLLFLMANDNDEFNRYEAAQVLMTELLEELLEMDKSEWKLDPNFSEAFSKLMKDKELDPAAKALILGLPTEGSLHQRQETLLIDESNEVRAWLKKQLAEAHSDQMLKLYNFLDERGEYRLDPIAIGKRSLRNRVLDYLRTLKTSEIDEMVFNQFDQATNMTDEISGLSLLIANDSKHRKQAIEKFYDKWKHETLVMQKWMGVQTANMGEEVFDRIPELENDDVYDKTVPNLVRSIFRGFLGNHKQFHDMSGRGYKLIVDRILEIDSINPQMAAGLCRGFAIYKKLDEQRRSLVNEQLNRVLKTSSISKNTYEVVSKILA